MEEQTHKKPSVKKNYIYNLLYQAFSLIVPLIVTPYVARKLLPEGNGIYSYSFSLITYFTLLAALGFGFYAQREIAKHQGDKATQSRLFWEMNICRLIPVFLSLAINIILCLFNAYGDYTPLMWVMNLNIGAVAFDIAFYFQGNEEFGKLVLRSGIVKALTAVLIFVFVKEPSDLLIYTWINAGMMVASNLIMWFVLPKYLSRFEDKMHPLKHMKGSLRLFIPTLATTLYTVLDKTLIGVLIQDTYTVMEDGVEVIKKYSDLENGYYEQSEKIVKLAMTVITCIGTVMIPRNSALIAEGKDEKVKENIYISSRLVWLIGIPMSLGFAAVASNFVPWYFGEGYEKCIPLIMILAFLILIIGFSNVFGIQYLLPYGKDTKYMIALVSGAIINLTLNFILIPFFWSIGAAIASIVAELSISVIMLFMIRKEVSVKRILLPSIKYIISGLVMFGGVYALSYFVPSSILWSILMVLGGIIIYFVMLLILRDSLILGILKRIFHKKNKNEESEA